MFFIFIFVSFLGLVGEHEARARGGDRDQHRESRETTEYRTSEGEEVCKEGNAFWAKKKPEKY